jgi:predicted RNA binding protein YcfA (HicA-like mRNA interferase family)
MKVKDVIWLIEKDGWQPETKGSHRQFKHFAKPGTVTVSGKESLDVPPGNFK